MEMKSEINHFLEQMQKLYPGKKLNLVANDKSLDLISYSYLGRNLKHSIEVINLAIEQYDPPTWLDQFLGRKKSTHHTILYSLFDSFVMNYIKCFDQTTALKIGLNPKRVYRDNESLKALHTELDFTRNKIIAHDGKHDREASYCIFIEDPKSNIKRLETPIMTFKIPTKEKLKGYRNLTKVAMQHVENKREKALKNFLESVGLTEIKI